MGRRKLQAQPLCRVDGGKVKTSQGRRVWGVHRLGADASVPKGKCSGQALCFWFHPPRSRKVSAVLTRGSSDTAAERGAVQLGGGPGAPGLLVLLGQQQHEGHGQGAVVEAVHVGVIPLLEVGRALVKPAGSSGAGGLT